MIGLQVVKTKMQHNLLSPFEDANALYVTNKTVLIIIFINIRMIYRYSCLTNHFQDVTKQGPLLLRRHLPTSLLIRVQTSLQQHVHIFIWHLIHFCHFRFPDFSNPLKSLQTPRCNTLNSLARLEACCFGAAEMVVLSSQRPAVLFTPCVSVPVASQSVIFFLSSLLKRDQDGLCERSIGTTL